MNLNTSLIGTAPQEVLVHGPKKLLLNKYHWHMPNVGIVASYNPTEADVEDHFGIFRGVDQIEAFAQASIVSCSAYIETQKQKCTFDYLKKTFTPLFISIGGVHFRSHLQLGDTFISMAQITFYKYRQMTCDGRIYKVAEGLDIDEYFENYSEQKLLNYDLSDDFTLIAELFDVTGRGIKK
jgi:hypothetical protein